MESCILTFVKFLENEGKIDEQDLSTLEFSRRLREKINWKLIGATVVGEESDALILSREVFSRGADEVLAHIWKGRKDSDVLSSAFIMKRFIDYSKCKLVVFGERSSDTSSGSLGAYVAGLSGMSLLMFVKEVVEIQEKKIVASSVLNGEILIRAELPAVLIPAGELFSPRPVLIRDRLEAKRKSPSLVSFNEEVNSLTRLLSVRKPEYRKRSSFELKSAEEILRVFAKVVGDIS
ncbi:MAG: hypothetical protein QW039_03480 [Fervidicoccaceae archaeon]